MAQSKKILIALIGLILLTVSAVTFVYAFLIQEIFGDEDRTFGHVLVLNPVYYQDTTDPEYVGTIDTFTKTGIYKLNISSTSSPYHINKFRIDFDIQSNINTYFRVRIIDTLTIVYTKADDTKVEISIPSTSQISFNIATNHWYYDQTSDWYYYKSVVVGPDMTAEPVVPVIINFIEAPLTSDLIYPLYSNDFFIQLAIQVEAVQAVRGPKENWYLTSRPWDALPWN